MSSRFGPSGLRSSRRTSTAPLIAARGFRTSWAICGRQLAQRRQPIGPTELVLHALALGEILEDCHQACRLAVGPPQGRAGDSHGDRGPILSIERDLQHGVGQRGVGVGEELVQGRTGRKRSLPPRDGPAASAKG